MKLSDGEKLILVMLSEIHQNLGIKDGIDPKFVQSAIYTGCAWGLKRKYPGIFDAAESEQALVSEVVNLLDMWSFIESSCHELSDNEKALVVDQSIPAEFTGFDGNNEIDYIGVARFLINDLGQFAAFKRRDLNSHYPGSLQ
jgi:hypothetical protein